MGNIVNFKPKPTTIEVKLVKAFGYRRRPCTVCGGWTEKIPILAEGRQDLSSGDYHAGEHRIVRVCETCLRLGAIDDRLELHARQMEAAAQSLREMIGRLQVPTFEEWQARCEQHEREWMKNNEKLISERIEEIEASAASDDCPF